MRMLYVYSLPLALLFSSVAIAQQADTLKNKTLSEVVILSDNAVRSNINKLDVPIKSLPATINMVNAEALKLRGVDDMLSALQQVEGVRPVATYGAFQHYVIRGFNDFLLLVDGFRDDRQNIATSATMTNLAAVDQIEVLKGPGAAMFGHSGIGGIINIIRKQPSEEPVYEFNVLYGSYNNRRISAGAGGAITKKLRYRADFGMSADDGWRGGGSNRNSGYLALDYTLTDKDYFQWRIAAYKDVYNNDAGIPTINGEILPGVKRRYRYNVSQDLTKSDRADIQLQYTRKINDRMTITEQACYAADLINYFSAESLDITAGRDSVARTFFQFEHHTKPFQNTLDFKWDILAGQVRQKILAGWSLNVLDRYTDYDNILRSKMATTIALMEPFDNQGHVVVSNTYRRIIDEVMNGWYVQDWINFSPKLKVLAAIRYDNFAGNYRTDTLANLYTKLATGKEYTKKFNRFTYRAGFVYNPLSNVDIYGSYATYFKPARQIPSVTTLSLNPETGYQSELGARLSFSNILSLNITGFYLLKNNIIVSLGKGLYDQASEAASKGIEAELTWHPFAAMVLTTGYAYTDARFINYTSKITGAGNLAGKRLPYAMEHQFNLQVNYMFTKQVNVFAGLNYNGSNYTNSGNTILLPAYTLLNAGAAYTFQRFRVAVNVGNLLDNRNYFISAINNTQLYAGIPVNYNVALRYKFKGS